MAADAFRANLVSQEVKRIVAEAVSEGRLISAQATAAVILQTYPNCGMSKHEIADAVRRAAIKAGVAGT